MSKLKMLSEFTFCRKYVVRWPCEFFKISDQNSCQLRSQLSLVGNFEIYIYVQALQFDESMKFVASWES